MADALTKEHALRAYARMMNTLDPSHIEPLLASDFHYSSQAVLAEMESKAEFMAYIRPKLRTIAESGQRVFAEMATVVVGYPGEPCVVLAQGRREDRQATVLATVEAGQIKRLDMCIIPTPEETLCSGEYPA